MSSTSVNHGKPWAAEHYATLFDMFCAGASIRFIADSLGRQTDAVEAKLEKAGLFDPYNRRAAARDTPCAPQLREYYAWAVEGGAPSSPFPPHAHWLKSVLETRRNVGTTPAHGAPYGTETLAEPTTTPTKENTMELTTQTLLNGRDITTFSDAQLFHLIANAEAEIANLERIAAKPNRLVRVIAAKKQALADLIEYLNANDE